MPSQTRKKKQLKYIEMNKNDSIARWPWLNSKRYSLEFSIIIWLQPKIARFFLAAALIIMLLVVRYAIIKKNPYFIAHLIWAIILMMMMMCLPGCLPPMSSNKNEYSIIIIKELDNENTNCPSSPTPLPHQYHPLENWIQDREITLIVSSRLVFSFASRNFLSNHPSINPFTVRQWPCRSFGYYCISFRAKHFFLLLCFSLLFAHFFSLIVWFMLMNPNDFLCLP